jgi:hypothetical protein
MKKRMLPPGNGCVVCGLVACAHLVVLDPAEAMHLHPHQARPAYVKSAPPPELDHGHRDYGRSVRVQLARAPVLVSARYDGFGTFGVRVGGAAPAPGVFKLA